MISLSVPEQQILIAAPHEPERLKALFHFQPFLKEITDRIPPTPAP